MSEQAKYIATTIISPLIDGAEKKDQDRAQWYEPGQTAALSDGVTTSLYSQQAAELVTLFIPSVFDGKLHERLEMLCDTLMAHRINCKTDTLSVDPNASPAMQKMLRRVIQDKTTISFQTTVIAVRLISDIKCVTAEVLKCGDSAMFAFSPQGQLLSTTLDSMNPKEAGNKKVSENTIQFGPGDEILVRVEGALSRFPHLHKKAGISTEYANNWFICKPIDQADEATKADRHLFDIQCFELKPRDLLVVPKYLIGVPQTCKNTRYRMIHYSSNIKPLFSKQSMASLINFEDRGCTTMVLPDHFYCGCYEHYQDRFSINTHFLLCSDGFYGAFDNWPELWTWLQHNKLNLESEVQKNNIMKKLHEQLQTKGGDDDISFIWIRPREETACHPQK